jgi:hypothetical protein
LDADAALDADEERAAFAARDAALEADFDADAACFAAADARIADARFNPTERE